MIYDFQIALSIYSSVYGEAVIYDFQIAPSIYSSVQDAMKFYIFIAQHGF